MIKAFFERELNEAGEEIDNRHYFHDMKIMSGGEDIVSYMGRYPVISFSLKSARQPNFGMAYQVLAEQIAGEFRRHSYVLKIDFFTESETQKYQRLMAQKASAPEYATALKFLADCLKKFYNQRVIILLDEYDVPLENAYFKGFYDEMTDYIRSLFESALKTNDSLEFAVITGCLRISREIEDLIAGKYIEKPIHEEVTYGDIHRSQDYLWNFLLFTGYLRKRGERQEQRQIYHDGGAVQQSAKAD